MTETHSVIPLLKYLKGSLVPSRKAFFIMGLLLLPLSVFAQKENEPVYDEIAVTVEVRNVGNIEVPALYNESELYLSLIPVFDFIKIKNLPSASFDTIRGFFINERDTFLIDAVHQVIHFKDKVFELKPHGLVKSGGGLYMELKYFRKVFGLDGVFSFRRLVVSLSADFELPATIEMKQEQMRRNVNRLQGNIKADTSIHRSYPFFHFGMADWAVMSSQQSEGPDQTTLNLGLGGVLAGGELNASLNYYSQQPFTEKLQYYQWRFVNNDNTALRQVVAGKIFAQATSTLYAPVVGVQVTNAPTTYRKSYGTYTLSNTTQPGWTVELYVNDVLVDYKKADASGYYTFEVPLIYGYTIVKLRFYGPYGEERTSQQYINIPFNFLPKHEFEYSLSGGIVEDNKDSKFSRLRMNYGLSENITFGGGVEYLSSVTSGNTMPFLNTSVRLSSRMLFTGEYTYGVRSRALLNYRLPAGIQLDLDYTNYTKGQTAIYYNYLEERKVVITMPLSAKGISLFSRLTLDQVVVPQTKYTNAEWVITGFVHRLGFNISTYSSIVEYNIPYIYSILGLTIPIPGRIIFSPQVQYDYKENKPVFMKFIFEKRVSDKGLASVQFQDYFSNGNYNFLVGLRYDLSAVKLALSVLQGNNNTYSRVEAASGSLVMDSKSKYFNLNNRSNVGRGGVFIEPFLDLNNNGQKDPGEPKVPGLKIRVNGGRIFYNEKDTTIRIIDLEPYNNYIIELERNSFDNISWQIKNKILSVTANPNNFTYLEVPVRVVGEVSGTVSLNGRDGRGQGQILINVFDSSGLAAKVITESDGFYSYLGLAPGSYTVRVDSTQLHNLHLKAQPAFATVKIAGNRDGDVADGLDFILQPVAKDTTVGRVTAQDTGPESSKIPVEPRIIGEKGSYTILVDVYDNITTAGIVKTWLTRKIVNPVTIVQTGDDYKVEITGFPKKEDARRFLPIVENLGFRGPLIIRLKENIMR